MLQGDKPMRAKAEIVLDSMSDSAFAVVRDLKSTKRIGITYAYASYQSLDLLRGL
jgi:hypothetical protein